MSVKWISHRGESIDAPENSIPAFKLSLERRTDGMECDVHLTADQVVVVAHDPTTARMGDRNLTIAETKFEDLVKVNISGANETYPDEHIHTLVDTLAYLGEGREYYIELKPGCPALVPAVKKILADAGMTPKQIVIISFDRELIALTKQQMPEFRALWLTGMPADMTAEKLLEELRAIHADGVDAGANEKIIDREFVRKLHEAGMFVAVWTVDHPGQAKRFIEMGVDSITSNRAAKLRDLLAKK
ncbi:MAG: glycerophosphodiester phosphodiesterase [Lentisphaeria bacterium]|nr:glycerophosphodiester phosphodiesterase [Lentisphaeria bacterium]